MRLTTNYERMRDADWGRAGSATWTDSQLSASLSSLYAGSLLWRHGDWKEIAVSSLLSPSAEWSEVQSPSLSTCLM